MAKHEFTAVLETSFGGLVHSSVADDPVAAARHRSFIAAHLVGGFAALALVLPVWIGGEGPAVWLAALVLGMLGAQALVALLVARTGRYALGQFASATCIAALVAAVCGVTGGLSSFALVLFAAVPIEAALSGRRATIAAVTAVGAAFLAAVAAFDGAHVLPEPLPLPLPGAVLSLLAVMATAAFAVLGAWRLQGLHRRLETAAHEAAAQLDLYAAAVPDLVLGFGEDGGVVFASPAAETLTGVAPGALHGDGFFHRVLPADRPAYLDALGRATDAGEASVELQLAAPGARAIVLAELTVTRVAGAARGMASLVGHCRDIGRRKALEAEIARNEAACRDAARAKTRFLANVSHELRTPLNAIIGFSDLLGQELVGRFEQDRHRDYVRLIHESGQHLLQVVNEILDMSKIDSGTFQVTPEPFDVSTVLESCRLMMAHQAETAGLRLSCEVAPGLPDVLGDRRACKQILVNLLSNAVKFTGRGGEVVCGARREGGRIALYVRDTGIGIAEADLPRLGTPFVQVDNGYDRRHDGTGLGLSVVKGLTALQGGTMEIESRLGVGTVVTVRLPAHPRRVEEARVPDAAMAAAPAPLKRAAGR